MAMVFLVGRDWESEQVCFNRGRGGGKRGKGGEVQKGECRCPEWRDTDQSNPSLSKKLKGCVVDLLLARENMYGVRGTLECRFPQVPKFL